MTPQPSSSPPSSLWELHPVEAFLALLLISAAALLQLVANPPRPLRKRQALDHSHVLDSYSYSKTALASALAASQTRAAMAAAVQETVKQLRQPQSPPVPPRSQFADLLQTAGFKQVPSVTATFSAPMPSASFSALLSDLAEKQIENTYGIGRHSVADLRTMARQQGITTAGGRPIHKARRADLISALRP